ncbi:OmpA family protein [Psychromonas sp. CNPT3]|uniref:OmpA family protein n=1 Tax=Psychromonas sp. CNPT3 TaxID=314282 RepID=UPI00006E9E20|nr:OmpA family protein [Psychromonas sp. CNPT3]AGH80908.1 OmpA family protein [Psychromonas sp. CNPT3]
MNKKTYALLIASLFSVFACSTDTYVSQENINKYENEVQKFLISECLLPQRAIHMASVEHFKFDKYDLQASDQASIDLFIREIKDLKGRIAIVGHTDVQGSLKYNVHLSAQRAQTIKDYLSKQLEVKNYDWEIKYYGETKPLSTQKTLAANAANRRAYLIFEESTLKNEDPACAITDLKRKIYATVASHFEFDKSQLAEKDKKTLDAFINKLAGLNGRILIAGHTDIQGAADYNQALATFRARAVEKYLRNKLDASQFIWEVTSFGESKPIDVKHNALANASNRRAFVVFKEGDISNQKIQVLSQ